MTPEQSRMARAALKLTVREVERRTGVNKDAVSRYEAGKEILASALQKLEKLYRDEGIIFVDEDASGGQGVRLPAQRTVRGARQEATNSKSGKRIRKAK